MFIYYPFRMVISFLLLFLFFNIRFLVFCLFLLLLVAFLVLYERKLLGLIQERKGPNIVRLYRLLQTVADRIKLLVKGSYYNYISFYFLLLPFLRMFFSFCHWLIIPFPFDFYKGRFSVLITFVIIGVLVYVVLRCRYTSRSSYGVIRSIRSVAQIISYEVVFIFFILTFLFYSGDYSWKSIFVDRITKYSLLKVFFFVIWIVISSAELNRTPFDLVERESELVSRYNVEFSGYNFTLLFLSEYINIWFIRVIFGLLFSSSVFYLVIFTIIFVSLNICIRRILPRFKFLDLINLIWKVFLPGVFIYIYFYLVLFFN